MLDLQEGHINYLYKVMARDTFNLETIIICPEQILADMFNRPNVRKYAETLDPQFLRAIPSPFVPKEEIWIRDRFGNVYRLKMDKIVCGEVAV